MTILASNFLPIRLIYEANMENAHDWVSRLLKMMPVKGTADYRCFLGAPWRIDFPAYGFGEIPYHVILGGVGRVGGPGTRAQVVGLVGLMRAESATENLGGLATLNSGYSRGGVSSALRFACWSCALSAAEKSGLKSKTCRSSTATGTHLLGSRLLCIAWSSHACRASAIADC
jgi:hypothetical protein